MSVTSKWKRAGVYVLVGIGFVLVPLFGFGTVRTIPPYAGVFVSDSLDLYYGPGCTPVPYEEMLRIDQLGDPELMEAALAEYGLTPLIYEFARGIGYKPTPAAAKQVLLSRKVRVLARSFYSVSESSLLEVAVGIATAPGTGSLHIARETKNPAICGSYTTGGAVKIRPPLPTKSRPYGCAGIVQ